MSVVVRIQIHSRVVNTLLRSPFGPVARNMLTRGRRVQAAARRNVNSRTGTLARSINVHTVRHDGATGVEVGTTLYYARWVHDGTGIYGPTHRPIRPQRGRALAFPGTGGTQFAAYSRGQRGTKFLERALRAAG